MAITKTKDGIFKTLDSDQGQDPDLAAWGRIWNFPLNGSLIQPEHVAVLKALSNFLKENADFYCRIIALASRSGSNDFNLKVSEKRARNLHGWLVVHGGVAPNQLTHQ